MIGDRLNLSHLVLLLNAQPQKLTPSGKTMVAGLFGAILRDLGFLSRGDVVLKIPSDFMSGNSGSVDKTRSILESTRGKVLVRSAPGGGGGGGGAGGRGRGNVA